MAEIVRRISTSRSPVGRHVGHLVAPALAGALIVATPALGWAACAWVLWQRESVFEKDQPLADWQVGPWKVQGARETRDECQKAVKTASDQAVRMLGSLVRFEVAGAGAGYIATDRETGRGFSKDFLCLPDTVDPRT
jgi:hypothetical protein